MEGEKKASRGTTEKESSEDGGVGYKRTNDKIPNKQKETNRKARDNNRFSSPKKMHTVTTNGQKTWEGFQDSTLFCILRPGSQSPNARLVERRVFKLAGPSGHVD